jgi:hypothetical protein
LKKNRRENLVEDGEIGSGPVTEIVVAFSVCRSRNGKGRGRPAEPDPERRVAPSGVEARVYGFERRKFTNSGFHGRSEQLQRSWWHASVNGDVRYQFIINERLSSGLGATSISRILVLNFGFLTKYNFKGNFTLAL